MVDPQEKGIIMDENDALNRILVVEDRLKALVERAENAAVRAENAANGNRVDPAPAPVDTAPQPPSNPTWAQELDEASPARGTPKIDLPLKTGP